MVPNYVDNLFVVFGADALGGWKKPLVRMSLHKYEYYNLHKFYYSFKILESMKIYL